MKSDEPTTNGADNEPSDDQVDALLRGAFAARDALTPALRHAMLHSVEQMVRTRRADAIGMEQSPPSSVSGDRPVVRTPQAQSSKTLYPPLTPALVGQHSGLALVHAVPAHLTIPITGSASVLIDQDDYSWPPLAGSSDSALAARLGIDGVLVQHFRDRGLSGPSWDRFHRQLLTSGLTIVTKLVLSGVIFSRCAQHGRYLQKQEIPPQEAEELASDTVYEGFVYFSDRVCSVGSGRWSTDSR